MPEPQSYDVRSLLIEALKRAEIPSQDDIEGIVKHLFYQISWKERSDGEIELFFSAWHFKAGRFHCSFSLLELANSAIEMMPEGHALDTLVDILEYLKSIIFTLLPVTFQSLIIRSANLHGATSDPGSRRLFDMMQMAYVDRRAAMESKLKAERRRRRGGSEARLPKSTRETLHAQYDTLHNIAREVKKDYNQVLKRFEKERRGKGYPLREWRAYWIKYISEKYQPELIDDFLADFASEDRPSASDIAYIKLSKHTGHSRSYLPQLVTESRKAKSDYTQTQE